MPDPTDFHLSVRTSLPDTQLIGLVAALEADENGYAIMLCHSAKHQQVSAYTLGLTTFEHPEITCVGGNEDDVFALVSHVAEQVVEHGQVFSAGTHSTSLFSKLAFHDSSAKWHELPYSRLILGDAPVSWIQCMMPLDFINIRPQTLSQDLRRVA
ncbi:DUF4262 domain-containing protein [Glutamicibacter nicotianae]|uniref:DUF4262 domain-containing protein n=1 Tax=Glutamicibacter nicotianae TaxID=37929 RepID=UPI00167F94DC|nr:DUF4262 domain-containing protein [Glutamicibacter nicotianae]